MVNKDEYILYVLGERYLFQQHHQAPPHDEPKPNHSYIGIIAMAILGSKERKLVLSDIYQWILDNYPYFRRRGPGWRNSIRHNLSLNDCFIKAGRSANGKGHYWAIHPANVEDFEKGDFRRRRAQRKVRRAMGLSVADDDDDSPIPSPSTTAVWTQFRRPEDDSGISSEPLELGVSTDQASSVPMPPLRRPVAVSRKRLFDMESLLAPDADKVADKPEVIVPSDQPQQRDDDCYDVFPVPPPDRKRRTISPKLDDDDVIEGSRQAVRAVICDDDVTTTSGSVGRPTADDERNAAMSINTLSNRHSADDEKAGSRFESAHLYVDAETISGETTSGICADPEVARFWLRHANMASSRIARAFFPLPPTAFQHATDVGHDINQGRFEGHSQGHGQSQCHGQSRHEEMFQGHEMADFKRLSESVSPLANAGKNGMTP